MEISLICPTNQHGASATKGIYYPMGILLVGSLVKDTFPDIEVNIIDGETALRSELEHRIQESDIVGLSTNTSNYAPCLELANFAKETGVQKVVLGGPHASAILPNGMPMAELILRNQSLVDAVIVSDGEEPFLKYVMSHRTGTRPHNIENLFYREEDGSIVRGKISLPAKPPRFIDMDFTLMRFDRYWEQHKTEFPAMSERYIEGFTHVGCAWREKLGCSFCDIPYPYNNFQAPGRFWRDLREVKNIMGIESFKDYGDCLTGNAERVQALLRARPQDLANIDFSCYGRSSEITEEMADLLKELNVKYIYIGFDSGDNTMLKSMQEGYSVRASLEAIERLAKRGILITGSLILGAAGESEETIANTQSFAEQILHYSNITQLHCAMLTPFPGAPMNKAFLQAHPAYATNDIWDTELTKRFWVDTHCKASYEYMEKKAREINSLNPSSRKRYFGLKK
ncbi:MAG: radical SAM protein [Nanoarchaeota archaeon]